MKIQCRYCRSFFNDTNVICPHCGAPNPGVARTTSKQPLTVEELTAWYKEKGLPPAETTRFFIGANYTAPKAFGIYKDQLSGNFIVYKNKSDGTRVVRYEGADEAYAVNEIFQRLKQEIIEQKRRSINQKSPTKTTARKTNFILRLLKSALVAFSGFILLAAIAIFIEDEPQAGYYLYSHTPYYYYEDAGNVQYNSWYSYDQDWSLPISIEHAPPELQKNKSAKEYFVADQWNPQLPCTDFTASNSYRDVAAQYKVQKGYYNYEGKNYYHAEEEYYKGWFLYEDDNWTQQENWDVPDDLKHSSLAPDFFYTPVWDASTQFTDFEDSSAYEDYYSDANYDSWDNDDDDYGWDSSDTWDSDSSDWDSDW